MPAQAIPRLLSTSPKLPPEALAEGTKARMLEVALELFAERGYASTSIRDLAQELALQPTALYAHFPSKEHVLATLIRIGHENYHRSMRTALLAVGTDPVEQIRAFVHAHVAFHTNYAMLAVVINNELHALSPELGAPSVALRRQSEELLYEIVERGVAQHRFHPPHAFVTAAAIGAMGLRVAHWYRSKSAISAEEIAEAQAELAVRMLGVRP